MAKPTIQGREIRLQRRADGRLYTADFVAPPVVTPGIHPFTGLPLTPDGWTDLDAMILSEGYADARIVYVSSSSGNNQSGSVYTQEDVIGLGGTPTNPQAVVNAFATIEAARAHLRYGFPDVLLLKRGDFWYENLETGLSRQSGRSNTERKIYAAYGASGPLPNVRGIITAGSGSGGAPATADHIIVAHIDNYHPQNDPAQPEFTGTKVSTGVANLRPGSNILLEGLRLRFSGISYSVSVAGTRIYGLAIRRNVISESYPQTGHAQGLYTHLVDGLLIEENILDHNGWIDRDGYYRGPTQHNHNVYLSAYNWNVVAKGNSISRASSHAFQGRPGALLTNNLAFLNPLNPYIGSSGGEHSYNVVLDSRIQPADAGSGRGILDQSSGIALVYRNIVAHKDVGGTSPFAFYALTMGAIESDPNNSGGTEKYAGPKNAVYRENVLYKWRGIGFYWNLQGELPNFAPVESVTFVDNKIVSHPSNTSVDPLVRTQSVLSVNDYLSFSGNQYESALASPFNWFGSSMNHSQWVSASGETGSVFGAISFPDPERDITSYMTSIGETGGPLEFISRSLQMNRWNWDSRFTAPVVNSYIRAGFGVPDPS
jgi:hypothetical protein